MNENAKTLTVLAVAAVAVAAAVLVSRPAAPIAATESVRNQPLFPKLDKDPLAVTRLEIVDYDEETAEAMKFEVAQEEVHGKTRWVIPSHDDYPADAKDQVATAASSLMGLKIIEMVSDNKGDRREYGVVDPDPKSVKVGETGVGEKVVMKNTKGETLLDIIIGKEVPKQPNLRYVRKAGDDGIYVVAIKTDKLSTKFEEWIERNLLGISSFDISRLWIRDYAIKMTREGLGIIQNGEMSLEHNDAGEPKWTMLEDRKLVPEKSGSDKVVWEPVKMAADQELNTAKLDEMMTALDDLKIIDIRRKPKGLSADLKAASKKAFESEAAQQSMTDKGFFLADLNGQVELFSNDGETRIGGKDGVEYVLRFGDIAGASSSKKDEAKDGKKTPDKDKKSGGPGLSRYLFIVAEFEPELIPKPLIEPLPKPKHAAPAASDKQAAAKNEKPADSKAPTKEPVTKVAEKKSLDQKVADKEAVARKAEEAERARIELSNKRNQEEYDQKIAAGKKRVAELNERFADWYYIISDDVYRKIHLGREDIVQKKQKEPKPRTP